MATVHVITGKTDKSSPTYRSCNKSNIRKLGVTRYIYKGSGRDERSSHREPRFEFTTGLLRLNKQIYTEALPILRSAPVIIDCQMLNVFNSFHLTIAHYIPFAALKHIEHIHFDNLGSQYITPVVWQLLWAGGKLTADINQGRRRQQARYPGILKAGFVATPETKQSDPSFDRHSDTYPEGQYTLRKVSFESLCKSPMEVDLSQATVVSLD